VVPEGSETARIIFTPSGRQGFVAYNTTILDAAREIGADLGSICGGRARCGRCRVHVESGTFAKHGLTSARHHLSEIAVDEHDYAARRKMADGDRLGCQARIVGDLVIVVPMESQQHRQIIRKRAEARCIEIDPVLTLHDIEIGADGALAALAEQWGMGGMDGLTLNPGLNPCVGPATAVVRDGGVVIDMRPGVLERAYGLAIDIGSTTLAAHLVDLGNGEVVATASAMNPQIRFGEDVMSRVSYAMTNDGGADAMTDAVRTALDELVGDAVDQARVDRGDVYEAVIVGNPIMHHIYLGLDPVPLGLSPFPLQVEGAVECPAKDLGLSLAPNARIYLPPCIEGHVGADAAAMVLSEGPHLGEETILLIDVGTNAEIVLGNRHRLLAASSPTGPALEGAQISSGQRAAPGAIERVRIDRETGVPRFRVIGCDHWSDEDGFDVAPTGICGSGIIEAVAEMAAAGIIKPDGGFATGTEFLLHPGEPDIVITQADVRAVQLAKGALHAGARLLMDHFGVEAVDQVVLAGAFGSQIAPIHAMALGLIPDGDPDNVSSAGNAAGTGARIALLNKAARREIEAVVQNIERVETATEPDFQTYFVDAMAIPHATLPYENLRAVMLMPMHQAAGGRRRRQHRQRNRGGG
jgi:uncharacterized 2Fe-2S/4Fe-4S cluster protein (DUF4445 family)